MIQKLITQEIDKIRDTRKYLVEHGYGHLEVEDKMPLEDSIAKFRSLI